MPIREKFKRVGGKLKAKLGIGDSPAASTHSLPITHTNPVPNPPLRAHSQSPVPWPGTELILPHVESQAKTSDESVRLPASSIVSQALGDADLHPNTFTPTPSAQGVSSSTDPVIESHMEADDNTAQATHSIPDIQVNPPIPTSIPTPIYRSLHNNQNPAVQPIVSPLGPEVHNKTDDPSVAPLVSLPTPNQIPPPARETSNDIPAVISGSQNALIQTVNSSPGVPGLPLDATAASQSPDADEQNGNMPLDARSPPTIASTVDDTNPNLRTEQTRPELDARVTSQVTTSMLGPAHEDADDRLPSAHSLLDSQETTIVTTSSDSETALFGSNRPTTHTPAPTRIKSTLADSAWKAFDGFRRVLGGIANEIGPLKLVMDELSGLIGMYEDAANARTDYAALRTELEELFSMLSTHFSGNVPPTMTAGINNLCTAIERELNQISTKEDRQMARRLVESKQDLDEVMQCYRRIQGHLKRLNLNVDLSIWKTVDEQASENRLKSLAPALSACYNSAEALQVGRRECTPNTRKQVLADLSHWRHDKNMENMYWLNGMAGTGKTTIASSLCAMLDQSHELGASFFCTRLLPECRNVKLILPTIAYQLARLSRPFYHALSMALQADPDMHTKALPVQLQGLMIDPLRKAALALPEHVVIVIDALDECEDGRAVSLLLEVLAKKAADLPLKIFVSSRPEPQIREKIGETTSKLILHELEASIVKQDIELYLRTELSDISAAVSEGELAGLVERAGVLFIYAATAVRYINSVSAASRRQNRVREILEVKSSGSGRTNKDIDALYSAILTSAFDSSELNDEEIRTMRLVLNTVICAREPLTIPALAGLLGLGEASVVADALEPLWSVLHISSADKLVSTLHASFPDYMLDPTRSKDHVCQSDEHNGRLAKLCFNRIDHNERQFNICGLESSYVFDDDVPDLDKRVQMAIPQDLWYACRYWAAHLKLGEPSAERLQWVTKFVGERLLLWMEVLNLKKQINVGALMFETVYQWCKEPSAFQETKGLIGDVWRFITTFATNDVSRSASQEAKDLIHDAWRFTTMFATNDVSRSTTHLYISMLASWPKPASGIDHYRQRAKGLETVGGSGMSRRQLALLCAFSAKGSVSTLAFSPDGTRIASGSYGKTIRVWDAQTSKALLHPLKGHTDSVKSVAFSPDGMRIVSGSRDKTIRVWDAQTGKLLFDPLNGHTDSVKSVAFSPDGNRIVSGSNDKTIRVWDAQTGKLLFDPLNGHTDSVKSVAFSPDGNRIVSGSNDKTIRVWDAQTSKPLLDPLKGHAWSVKSVAFSPDGMRIVSGSRDKTIRVWDAQTGKPLLDPLNGHTESVNSVAFSPDGMRIVSGSSDKTIRVWDAQTGKTVLDPLNGHTESVNSVAFSPDGMRIVSGSSDKTIRVWDAQTSKPLLDLLNGHTYPVNSVAFSSDGMHIVSGSSDMTIRVWDAQTGKPLLDPLKGHAWWVNSVAFSPDGMRIVSGSYDKTIRVWDAQTGKPLLDPLKGHAWWVNSVAFSPDGNRIVSGSNDNTIQVWDAQTGKPLLDPLNGHTYPVNSVAFSPDGMRIISGSHDTTIRVWDAQTGKALLDPLNGHTHWVNSVAFSPDGNRIVSGSSDKTIQVWDAQTGKALLDPLNGHTHWVNSVAFSPDGNRIVSGSFDRTIRVWDAQTGKALLDPLKGHTDSVLSVAFSPDGMRIVSGSHDNTIRMWNLDGLLVQTASATQPPESPFRRWKLDERGWVRDPDGRPLLWLPSDLHDRLVLPNMTFLVSTEGSVELDFNGAKIGDSWVDCYAPCPRIEPASY